MSLSVGQTAPNITLKNTEGEVISLSDFRGKKVVLVFFPFAFTGICTAELCAIRDNADNFIDDETVVVSISCDSSPTLKNFKEQENFSHILLSDFWPHGEVARAYGVFLEERGMATRGTFVIDREGVIQWLVINEPGAARNTADYRDALAKIG
jgi:peroxiredoxin